MSTGHVRGVATLRRRSRSLARLLVRAFVGDRVGLVLFLGTLAFVGLYWRIGIYINDSYTVANAVAALADGHLVVDEAVYGSLEAPGMVQAEGQLYGRNYGQVALAVLLLWGLEGATMVADPGLVFATLWSLVVLALFVHVGHLFDRPSLCATLGAVAALSLFGLNAFLAEPLSARLLAAAALQLSAILMTALAVATFYRLLARLHGRRVGLVGGAMTALATPVGFWASIPKRHAYVLALLLGAAYALYRSRSSVGSDTLLSPTGFRAVAYALVGLVTWVHAGEGFVVFLALVAVDVPTAPSNDVRTLAVVGTAFAVSLIPFFLTNILISGDPLSPPRMLNQYGDVTGDSTFGSTGGSGGGGDSGGGGGSKLLPPALLGPVSIIGQYIDLLFSPFVAGVRALVDNPEALYQTFVRAGYIESVSTQDNNEAINLSVLESTPLVAGTVGVVTLAGRRLTTARRKTGDVSIPGRIRESVRRFRTSPVAATDAFIALSGLFFVLIYIPRLPVYAQVTVRYLMPLYPFALYAMARQASLRRALASHARLATWSYLAGVLLGAQVFFVVVTVGSFGRGGAFQLHAVVGLAAAAALGLSAAASALDHRADRLVALTSALGAALGTNLVLLSGIVYFQYGPYALPVVDWLADLLSTV